MSGAGLHSPTRRFSRKLTRTGGSVSSITRIKLGEAPEEVLGRLDRWDVADDDVENDERHWGSDREYADHVRKIDADTPARFNADARRLHEASGCAGKLAVFAVRLDTFPADEGTRVFYIGTSNVDELTEIRRHILGRFETFRSLVSTCTATHSTSQRRTARTHSCLFAHLARSACLRSLR